MGAIDRRQLVALLGLTLRQLLRPGVDRSSGSKGHPLRQIVFSMGLLGLLFTGNVGRLPDLASYLALLFAVAFVFVALAISPETHEVRQRNIEILSSKPIAPATLVAGRAVILLVIAGLISGCFGLAPLLAAWWRLACPLPLVAAEYAMLILGAFTAAMAWLYALLAALRFVSPERLRFVTQSLLVLAILAVTAMSTGLYSPAGLVRPALAATLIELLPSTWFARFWMADLGFEANAQRAGVLLLGAATIAAARGGFERFYPRLTEAAVAEPGRPVVRPLTVRLLEAVSRLPLLGGWLLPRASTAVASAILTLTVREEVSRLRVLVPQVVAALFFILGLRTEQATLPLSMLAYFGLASVIDGLDVVRQSPSAPASWIFFKTPIEARQVRRGIRVAIMLRFLALPLLLLTVLLLKSHPPLLAALLATAYLFVGRFVIAGGIVARPAFPLSQDQRAAQSFLGLVLGFVLSVAGSVAYLVAVFLVTTLGWVGLAIAAVAVAGLAAATLACELWASERLARAEYPH